uniref:Coiled-coil domain containing 191 n=1 Tax=Maylandia zebra TaxID=106582 RepID=A0A3P9D5J0_9CICH
MASEFAVSEVFSHKKPHSGISSLAVPLQSTEQLRDHDEAYSEGRLQSFTSTSVVIFLFQKYLELYNCLVEEEEQSAVKGFLQDLMEQELLDSRMMEDLALDAHQTRKRFRDPIITMEARHQQVRENRAQREAERQRQQRERDVLRAAREEAKKREQEEEMRKRQEKRRQEEMVQQEMVRLRRRFITQQITLFVIWFCLQRHFSGWYSVVLDRRLRMGKAKALYDWKRQLKAWRAWRAVMWAERKQHEVARTEEALRTESRQCQLAAESDRRRLLRRCLNEWQLWCRTEKEQRELLARQQEIKQKMAALISAASAGKLKATESLAYRPIMAPPEAPNRTTEKVRLTNPHVISNGLLCKIPPSLFYSPQEDRYSSDTLAPETSALPQEKNPMITAARPSQPWQVTRRHAAPTAAELHRAWQKEEEGGACTRSVLVSPGSRFENRHAAQKQIIAQQRKLLKEQQEQITRLKQEQNMRGLRLEMERAAKVTQSTMLGGLRPKTRNIDTKVERYVQCISYEPVSSRLKRLEREVRCTSYFMDVRKKAELRGSEYKKRFSHVTPCRILKIISLCVSAQREEEKQRQLKRQRELMALARQHHCRTLLLRRGLAPWKRLIQLRQASLAERHHTFILLKQCTLGWQQSARESVSDKEACADQLHQHFLLRRSLTCWKRVRIHLHTYRRHPGLTKRNIFFLISSSTCSVIFSFFQRVLRQCFLAWRQLPCLLRKEREKDERREKLCRKVTEVLPDFCSHPL